MGGRRVGGSWGGGKCEVGGDAGAKAVNAGAVATTGSGATDWKSDRAAVLTNWVSAGEGLGGYTSATASLVDTVPFSAPIFDGGDDSALRGGTLSFARPSSGAGGMAFAGATLAACRRPGPVHGERWTVHGGR